MFYRFRQNNSGGSFGLPAIDVYIEADSSESANKKAQQETQIYFNDEYDCPCCGSRWDMTDDYEAYEELPEFENSHWAASDRVPTRAVYYANGEVETR